MNKNDVIKIINNSRKNQYFNDATNFYLVSKNKKQPINLDNIYKQLQIFSKAPYGIVENFENSSIAKELENMLLNVVLYISVAVVLSIIGFVFINFIMKKEFNRTEKQIGIFKALGYNKYELSLVFAIKVFVVMFVSIILGYIISLPVQVKVNQFYVNSVTSGFSSIYGDWQFMLILFLLVPFCFLLISFLVFQFYLSKKTLHLISQNNLQRISKFKLSIKKLFSKCHFLFRIQLAFTLKSFFKWLVVCIIFMITTSLFLISFTAKDIFVSSYNNVYATYNNDINKVFAFDQYAWSNKRIDSSTSEQYLAIVDDYPVTFIANNDNQATLEIMKNQAEKFRENLVKVNNKKTVNDFLLINFTHQAIYLQDFKKLIQLFETFLKQNKLNIDQYSINLDDIKKQLFELAKINNLSNQVFISINQYWYNQNDQLPFFKLKFTHKNIKLIKKLAILI